MVAFNMIADFTAIVLSGLIFFLMIYTKPRRTAIYFIDFIGIVLSFFSAVLHIWLLMLTYHPQNFNAMHFNLLAMLYFVMYSFLLILIFTYIAFLSSKRHLIIKQILCIDSAIFVISFIANAVFLLTGRMYIVTDNMIILTPYFHMYLIFGIIVAALCFAISILNRHTIAKPIFSYIIFFIPIDFFSLILQFLYPHIQYVGMTCILPFAVFYFLFHSNPYDELSGCQNRHSFETRIMNNYLFRRKYLIVNVIFPKIQQSDYDYVREHVRYLTANRCRQVERINNHMHLFLLNLYNYAANVIKLS